MQQQLARARALRRARRPCAATRMHACMFKRACTSSPPLHACTLKCACASSPHRSRSTSLITAFAGDEASLMPLQVSGEPEQATGPSRVPAPKGTSVAASNQAMLGSCSTSLASGSRMRKSRNLPYDTKPSSSAPSALPRPCSPCHSGFLQVLSTMGPAHLPQASHAKEAGAQGEAHA